MATAANRRVDDWPKDSAPAVEWTDDELSELAEYICHCCDEAARLGYTVVLDPSASLLNAPDKRCAVLGAVAIARLGARRAHEVWDGYINGLMRVAGMPRGSWASLQLGAVGVGMEGFAELVDPHDERQRFWGVGMCVAEYLMGPDTPNPYTSVLADDAEEGDGHDGLEQVADAIHETLAAFYVRLTKAQGIHPRAAAGLIVNACIRSAMSAALVCESELREHSFADSVSFIEDAIWDLTKDVGNELLGLDESELPESESESAPPGTVLQ